MGWGGRFFRGVQSSRRARPAYYPDSPAEPPSPHMTKSALPVHIVSSRPAPRVALERRAQQPAELLCREAPCCERPQPSPSACGLTRQVLCELHLLHQPRPRQHLQSSHRRRSTPQSLRNSAACRHQCVCRNKGPALQLFCLAGCSRTGCFVCKTVSACKRDYWHLLGLLAFLTIKCLVTMSRRQQQSICIVS